MGTVLGAFLTRAGQKIELITRNAEHVKALKEHGAHITGTVDFTVPVTAYTPEEMTGKYDLIFLMTKQRENAKICEFLNDYVSENGSVCTMQNGLPEPSVASVIGTQRTFGCAIAWGAAYESAGVVRLTSDPDKLTFAIGSLSGEPEGMYKAAEILKKVGKVEISDNFLGARWAKLAINSAFSSISAVTGLTFGDISRLKATRGLALDLLNEAFDTAEACGVTLEDIQGHDLVTLYRYKNGLKKKIALRLLPFAMKKHKDIVSGMYFDLKAGRQCDIDSVNGVVAHAARNFDVDVPLNHKVLEIAHKIERGELEISPANAELIKAD